MNDYKQECFKRLEYTQKYSKYNEEDLIEEIIEKDKQLDKYKDAIDKIKEYLNKNENAPVYLDMKLYETEVYNDILELLEEVE